MGEKGRGVYRLSILEDAEEEGGQSSQQAGARLRFKTLIITHTTKILIYLT